MSEEYLLTNGTKFIRKNLNEKYEQVSNQSIADTFTSYKMAKAIWKNALSRTLRSQYYVAKYENGELIQCDIPSPKKLQKIEVNDQQPIKYKFKLDDATIEWINKIESINSLFSYAKERAEKVCEELSIVEKELIDIEHFEEWKRLNAIKICKLHYVRGNLRRKRRSLKNEKKIIDAILSHCQIEKDINEIVKAIDGIKEQSYTPRILTELFEDDDILLKDINILDGYSMKEEQNV